MDPNRFALALVVAAWALSAAAQTLEVHYAPKEDLEAIDVDLIDRAEHSIDMAAYVLSDPSVIEALSDAADRGVTIRLYLDKGQFSEHGPRQGGAIEALLTYPNVFARIKGRGVQGNRLKASCGDVASEGFVVPGGDFASHA
jgi:phosphatidylserine/phosphatidylglycerophosphate/cardiolipin synthase-like enzyme